LHQSSYFGSLTWSLLFIFLWPIYSLKQMFHLTNIALKVSTLIPIEMPKHNTL